MENIKHAGITVNIGGTDYVVPPLTLGAIKRLMPKIEAMATSLAADGKMRPESMDSIVEVVHAALLRNYPDMTLQELEDMLDVKNIADIMQAVLGVSGLERKAAGSGEAQGAH